MPIPFRCPSGHLVVAEDYYAGFKVRCRECDALVIVPDARAAPEALGTAIRGRPAPPPLPARGEGVDDRSFPPPLPHSDNFRVPGPSVLDHPYHRVRIGLALHYSWLLIYLIAIALALVAFIAASDPPGTFRTVLILINFTVWIALFFAKPLLGILGSIFCLRVPSGSRARPFLWTSMVFDVVSVVLGALFLMVGALAIARREQFGLATGLAALVLLSANYLCNYLAWIFLMVFLHRFSTYATDWGTASEALPVGFLGSIVLLSPVLIGILAIFLIPTLSRDAAAFVDFFGYFFVLLWIVSCVKVFLRNLAMLSGLREHLLKQIQAVE